MLLLLSFEQSFDPRFSRFVGDDSASVRVNLHCNNEVNIVKDNLPDLRASQYEIQNVVKQKKIFQKRQHLSQNYFSE